MATERKMKYIFVTELKLQVRFSMQSLHRYTLLMIESQLFWKKFGDEAEVVQCPFKFITCLVWTSTFPLCIAYRGVAGGGGGVGAERDSKWWLSIDPFTKCHFILRGSRGHHGGLGFWLGAQWSSQLHLWSLDTIYFLNV